jgi:hypothetical protein
MSTRTARPLENGLTNFRKHSRSFITFDNLPLKICMAYFALKTAPIMLVMQGTHASNQCAMQATDQANPPNEAIGAAIASRSQTNQVHQFASPATNSP